MPYCQCQCGGYTRGGRFLPGHDARLKGVLLRAARGMRRISDTPILSAEEAVARLTQLGWLHFLTPTGTRQPLATTVSLLPIDSRSFGIEIEVEIGGGVHWDALGIVERAMQQVGLVATHERYNHETRSYWKVVSDGSLGRGGVEVVSPPLSGAEGLRQVKIACDALRAAGARVSRRCGLHVHLGAADLTLDELKDVVRVYERDYDEIVGTLAPSRRYNSYCHRWVNQEQDRLNSATSEHGVVNAAGRYKTVNLNTSYSRYKTVEFRQHQGTIEFRKIEAWLRLCMEVVNEARELSGRSVFDRLPQVTQQYFNHRRAQLSAR